MRKLKIQFLKSISLLLVMLASLQMNAQNSLFNFTIENDVQISDRILEFDLYLLDADAGATFELAAIQAGIIVNPGIYNGGTITPSVVAGFSQLSNVSQQPTSLVWDQLTNAIKLTPKPAPGAGSGSIISQIAPGTRICRIRITNSVAFTANSTANLTFNFTTVPYPTKVAQYILGINTVLTCDATNCFSNAANIVLNPPVPDVPVANPGSGAGCSQITANWSAAANATSYRLDVSTSNTFSSYVSGYQDLNVGNVLTRNVTLLTAGTTYYYRLRAVNSFGTSGNSNTITYATLAATPATPGTITGTTPQCPGLPGQIYSIVSVPNATSYTWTIPSGWSGSSTTNSITVTTGSAGQNGNITVTASNSCGTSAARSLSVTVSAVPATPGAISGITSQCPSLSGQVYSIVGVPNATSYTWTLPSGWAGSSITNSITVTTGSAGQNGNITVTASNSCGTSAASSLGVTVGQPAPAQPGAITGTVTQCPGLPGQVYSIVAVPNATTYTWTLPTGWSGSSTSNSITVTTGSAGQNGNISVTANNSCGISALRTLAVTVSAAPATPGVISGTTAQCAGLAGQVYSIVAVPNATTYTWTLPAGWSGSSTTNSITVTTGSIGQNGNISVTANNSCGASAPSSLAVTVSAAPATPGAITGDIAQCPLLAGQIYFIAAVPNAITYTWTLPSGWSGSSTTNSITATTGSAGQNGNITVTASNNCGTSAASSLAVTVSAIPAAPTVTLIQPTCLVGTGTITITAPTGAGMTYSIDGITYVNTTGIFTLVTPGTYSVTAKNAAGCISPGTNTTIITQPPIPVVNNQTASILSGGTFTVTPSGGTIPVGTTYTWPAPTYTGGVIGGVAQLTPLLNITGTLTIPSGVGTATYIVTPTSGTCVGATFTVIVTVTSTCTAVTVGTQAVNGSMCATAGPVTFTVTANGTAPFTYQWQYNNGVTWGSVANGTPVGAVYTNATTSVLSVTGISIAGSYQYRCLITNCGGGNSVFSNPATLTVNALPIPTLTSSDPDNVFCFGTSITFTAGGGTSYNFRVNGTTVQNGALTTYTTATLANGQIVTVIVTGADGCTATSAQIQNIVNPLPFIILSTAPTCSTDFLTYSLGVTVGSGTVTCPSGTVTNMGGNNWTISNIPAHTNVAIRVVDSGGCENTMNVTAPDCNCPVIPAPVNSGDRSYCAGGIIPVLSVTVPAGGNPKTVDWYNSSSGGTILLSGSLSYTPSAAGTYYAGTREISSSCVSSTRTSVILTMNPLPVTSLTSSDADNIFCGGTSVTFTAGGGTSYNFLVGGLSRQDGASATYTTSTLTNGQSIVVIVTNANGCSATSASITNTVNPTPVPTLTSSDADNSFCAGTNVTFTAGGGTNYNFRVAGVSVQNGVLTTYSTNSLTNGQVVDVVVSNAFGCLATSTGITNSVFAAPAANAGTGGNNCGLGFNLNGSLNVGTGTWAKVSGPGSVSFSPDANTPTALATVSSFGTYVFSWTVANGTCVSSANVTVIFIQQPPAEAGTGGDECDKDFIMKAVITTGVGTWTKISGPGTAVFTPDNHQANAKVTVDKFGTYSFGWTVVNSICTSSDGVTVVFHDLPPINAGRDTAFCKGGSMQLHAQGVGTVSWDPPALVNDPNIINPVATPITTTTFTVNLTDQFGCKNSDNIVVEVREKPIANAGPDQELTYVLKTTMDATLTHSYETGVWSVVPKSTTIEFADSTYSKTLVSNLSLGKNKFLWTVNNGYCHPASSDTVMITVNSFIIPTLITPNMDGINDYFVLKGLATMGKTELLIFDRRGTQVYRNTNYDNSWNGVDYNKNPLPSDTYFYVLKSQNGISTSGYIVIRR